MTKRVDAVPPKKSGRKKRGGDDDERRVKLWKPAHVQATGPGRPAARGLYAALAERDEPESHAATTIFMSETLERLNIWHHDSPASSGQDTGNGFTAVLNNPLSPSL